MSSLQRTSSSGPESPVALSAGNPMSKKLTKVLETKIDNTQTVSAMESLSLFFNENTAKSRRHLRSDIEKRTILITKDYLSSLEQVNSQLMDLESEVKKMSKSCVEMQTMLQSSRSQTSELLDQAGKLKREREKLSRRKLIAEAFLDRFTLTSHELEILSSSAEIKPEFFEALQHLRQIHSDCKQLLMTEHQKAGLEIMESMAIYQESAFEKLYRWTQSELKNLGRENFEISKTLQRALSALKDRSVLFNACIEDVTNTRRAIVVKMFIDALTKGGPSGTPKPIELYAHDPLRYVGDMLAWLHQSSASERELFEALLGYSQDTDEGGYKSFNPEEIQVILNKVFEGTCRPLRVRVDQILLTQPNPIISFKLTNLVEFYTITITKLIGESHLSRALYEITHSSLRVFTDNLTRQCTRILENMVAPSDASVPSQLLEIVQLLKDIMNTFETSLAPANERESRFSPVVDDFLSPVFNFCIATSSSLTKQKQSIFLVNCFHTIQTALLLHTFTMSKAQVVEKKIEEYLNNLALEQYNYLCTQSELDEIFVKLSDAILKGEENISRLPGIDSPTIAAKLKKFDKFLYSLNMENYIYLSVSSARLARTINQRASKKFLQSYTMMYKVIHDPKHKYEYPSTIANRTPEEIETILGLEE